MMHGHAWFSRIVVWCFTTHGTVLIYRKPATVPPVGLAVERRAGSLKDSGQTEDGRSGGSGSGSPYSAQYAVWVVICLL
jgi:hypothetical protein